MSAKYSATELARRTGVETNYIEQLVELGILAGSPDGAASFTPTDVRKVNIVRALEQGGMPLAGIGRGLQAGVISLDFVEQTSYERFESLSTESFRDVAQRTGLPVELLMVIREAAGSAQPSPDDRLRENELEIVPALEAVVAHGVRPSVMERSLRAYGEGIRRVADTESGWWRSDVIEPLIRAGKGIGMIGDLTATFATEIPGRRLLRPHRERRLADRRLRAAPVKS
jgi:DNA-binding transcriptional MerR regulator